MYIFIKYAFILKQTTTTFTGYHGFVGSQRCIDLLLNLCILFTVLFQAPDMLFIKECMSLFSTYVKYKSVTRLQNYSQAVTRNDVHMHRIYFSSTY